MDWAQAVRGNSFTNLQRLGRWTGGNTAVPVGTDPSRYFAAVATGSIGGGATPPNIYVLAHGWAPGYRAAVDKAGGNLLWWGSAASAAGIWTSDWAWSPVTVALKPPPAPPFVVNTRGMLQSIATFDPTAVILAYSWIDDSATDAGYTNLDEVYQSEAYTHVNGMRLANALQSAIAPTFWNQSRGVLRIIGHSHGSKVATVAALTLQDAGRRASHLTICDAPESEITLEANAANLLGHYLGKLQIADPTVPSGAGTMVDNYASYFGVAYAGPPHVNQVVEVALDPSKLYGPTDVGDRHSYAATWYGAAAGGAGSIGQKAGFAWPPAPSSYRPALNQSWPSGTTERGQWPLARGTSIHDTFGYATDPLKVHPYSHTGTVTGDPSTQLTFAPGPSGTPAWFSGYYTNSFTSKGYGVAFDLTWSAPRPGDYLVVAMMAPVTHDQETLLVMDGQSLPAGRTSIAINSVATSGVFSVWLWIYFIAAANNTIGRVSFSNFQLVTVSSASGYLESRRQAAAAQALATRAARAPRAVIDQASPAPR